MFSTYILQSQTNNKYYIGPAKDPIKRLMQHNAGKTKSIKNKGPFKIIYEEILNTRQEAYRRERQIKSFKGGEAFKKLLSRDGGADNHTRL